MTDELFHKRSDAGGSQFIVTDKNGGRDGRNKLRPSRLVHAARSGVTLVELLISMLILIIICIAWLKIIGVQSARKEARRREAVERLSGIMDAFLYDKKRNPPSRGSYQMDLEINVSKLTFIPAGNVNVAYPVFDNGVSPIGYRLSVEPITGWPDEGKFTDWAGNWLVGRLYDRNGSVDDTDKPFFTLRVCLGKR